MSDKAFIFLYPQKEIFDWELRFKDDIYKRSYQEALNKCIDRRYRQKEFSINYAILDDCEVSPIIDLKDSDNTFRVGMDSLTHRTKVDDSYPYPDNNHILNQLGDIESLRVGGFHAHDCCERLAKVSYRRGIDTLVDEDLTQFFTLIFEDPDFDYNTYPSVNPKDRINNGKAGTIMWELFLVSRKNKPWFIQDFDF